MIDSSEKRNRRLASILGDPGAVSRVDKMFVVKVYCKIDLTVNFQHEHFIDPTNCPWVSEDGWLLNFRIRMFVKSAILICGPQSTGRPPSVSGGRC